MLIDRSEASIDRLVGGDGDDILDCFDNPNDNFDDAQGGGGNDTFYVDDADTYPDWVGFPLEPLDIATSTIQLSTTDKP